MEVRSGDKIPLNLQLWNGDTSKYPKAFLRNPDGTAFGSADLIHQANGLYLDTSLSMPELDRLFATYIVFNDAAHLFESAEHTREEDVFETPRGTNVVLGPLTGSVDSINISGEMGKRQVEAQVTTPGITGVISKNDIEAEASAQSATGSVEDENVDGKLDC